MTPLRWTTLLVGSSHIDHPATANFDREIGILEVGGEELRREPAHFPKGPFTNDETRRRRVVDRSSHGRATLDLPAGASDRVGVTEPVDDCAGLLDRTIRVEQEGSDRGTSFITIEPPEKWGKPTGLHLGVGIEEAHGVGPSEPDRLVHRAAETLVGVVENESSPGDGKPYQRARRIRGCVVDDDDLVGLRRVGRDGGERPHRVGASSIQHHGNRHDRLGGRVDDDRRHQAGNPSGWLECQFQAEVMMSSSPYFGSQPSTERARELSA